MDTLTPERRSKNMSRIRSGNTAPELTVRRLLHRAGFRFRLHRKALPGTPDIVLPRYWTAIFVHGCFWHGHEDCRGGHRPKSNTEYWNPKIERNMARDVRYAEQLKDLGWKRIVVWACELKDMKTLEKRLITELTNGQTLSS